MNAHDRNRKLTMLGWLLHALGVFSLVAAGLAYHFVVSALIAHQRQKDLAETGRLESLLETAGDTRQEYQHLTDELAELERDAETMRQRIPDQPLEAEFLRQVTQAAGDEQVKIRDYRRGRVTEKDTHTEFEISLVCHGEYASMCGFLDRLASFSRATTVQLMNVTAPDNTSVYPFDITLTLYYGASSEPPKS